MSIFEKMLRTQYEVLVNDRCIEQEKSSSTDSSSEGPKYIQRT